ncbi:MAG: hypothetical protein AAF500_19120 [Myxococcota bacterium]
MSSIRSLLRRPVLRCVRSRTASLLALALALAAVACGDTGDPPETSDPEDPRETSAVAVLTGLVTPTGRTFLLHLMDELRPGTVLNPSDAFEFPDASISASGGFLYLVNNEDVTVTKYNVTDDFRLEDAGRFSMLRLGVQGAAAPQWDSSGRPYIVDTVSQQVVRFDPEQMVILDATPFPSQFRSREGIGVTVVGYEGVQRDERMWFNWSWVNYLEPRAVLEVALSSFPLGDEPPSFDAPIFDTRCPFSGGYPFLGPAGDLYTVGLSFLDVETDLPTGSCVLRVLPGESTFDPDYQLDLLAAADATVIGGAFPIDDGRKLVVHYLAKDDPQPDRNRLDLIYASTQYRTAVVDLATGVATEVEVPRTAIGSWKSLSLDGETYVQLYTEAQFDDARLTRIDSDGTAEVILTAGSASDFRDLVRIR